MRQSRFNPLSARQLQDTKEKLAEQKPAVWAEHQIEITTVAGKVEATGEPSRRFGVFFGASRFEFNAEAKEAAKGKWEPDRDGNANGANTVGSLMRERGRLTDLRVYTDQQATRPQLEQAITGMAPLGVAAGRHGVHLHRLSRRSVPGSQSVRRSPKVHLLSAVARLLRSGDSQGAVAATGGGPARPQPGIAGQRLERHREQEQARTGKPGRPCAAPRA